MKNPPEQGQHVIPDVYLKQFSFKTKGNQQKIKVLKKGQNGCKEEYVSSFNKLTNYFDIESENPKIERSFEEFHGPLETQYPKILDELSQNGCLTIKNASYLIHFTGNLISRSEMWREEILQLLNTDAKANFIKDVIEHAFVTQEEFDRIEERELFINLNNLMPENLINRILMLFNEYLFQRLQYFDTVFFKVPHGKSWFTTNNPVLLENHLGKFNFLLPESEIYFPLTLEYMVYIHCQNSKDKSNVLRSYKENTLNDFPDELFDELTLKIISNTTDYVVCPPECKTT